MPDAMLERARRVAPQLTRRGEHAKHNAGDQTGGLRCRT